MSYPPPPPVPQQSGYPAQAPVPAVPLNFPPPSSRQFERKPAVVTAIGMLSIIIGLATMIGSLFVIGWSLTMFARSQMPAMVFAPPRAAATPAPAPVVPPGPIEDQIDGLPRGQRQLVIAGLNRARPLTPQRTRQLDALLASKGRTMFPAVEPGMSPMKVRQSVTDSGVLPSASQKKTGPHYFIIGTGRVEVYDTHAVFRPTGSSEVTSVSAGAANSSPQPPAPRVVATPAPNAAAVKRLEVPAIVVGLEALLSGAVAIYLLIAGILVLRGSLSGSRLHWIYLAIKLPLAMLAIAASWWLWDRYLDTLGPADRAGFPSVAAILTLIGAVIAALYPIALIVILRSGVVRDYYKTAREEVMARPY